MRLPSRKVLGLSGLGVGLYLVFLINQIPAAFAWQYAPQQTRQQIKLIGIQGTIWTGNAQAVYYNGQELGKINWQLSPFSLLFGNLSVDAKLKGLAGEIEGNFTFVSQTQIEASDVRARLHAEAFNAFTAKAFPVPVLLSGEVIADIESLHLDKGKTLSLQGKVNWQDASIEGVQSFQLGQVKLNASPDNGGSEIKVNNKGAPLEIDGKLSLQANGQWNINLGLLNRDKKRNDIDSLLKFLGRPDTTGRYRFKQNGRLAL